jgi:hypothetical protein
MLAGERAVAIADEQVVLKWLPKKRHRPAWMRVMSGLRTWGMVIVGRAGVQRTRIRPRGASAPGREEGARVRPRPRADGDGRLARGTLEAC